MYVLFMVAICPNFQSGSLKIGTIKWTLKHTVSILKVFAQTNDEFSYYSYYDVNEYYSTVHLEWNLLLFVEVGVENDIVAYNMGSKKVHVSLHVTVSF